jgi:hypothetical protein
LNENAFLKRLEEKKYSPEIFFKAALLFLAYSLRHRQPIFALILVPVAPVSLVNGEVWNDWTKLFN